MNCFERLKNSPVLKRQLAGIWMRASQFNIFPEARLLGLQALANWGEDVEKISSDNWSQIYCWFQKEIRSNSDLANEFELCHGFKLEVNHARRD
jgi:hypothetical protein